MSLHVSFYINVTELFVFKVDMMCLPRKFCPASVAFPFCAAPLCLMFLDSNMGQFLYKLFE